MKIANPAGAVNGQDERDSVLATMGIGMLSSLVPLLACVAFTGVSSIVMAVTSILLLVITFVLYGKLRCYQLYEI